MKEIGKVNLGIVLGVVVVVVVIVAAAAIMTQPSTPTLTTTTTTATQTTTVTTTTSSTTREYQLSDFQGQITKIALVSTGEISKPGWDKAMYDAAMVVAEELGATVDKHEIAGYAEAPRIIRDYAEAGYQVIICHSTGYWPNTDEIAPDYPDTLFFNNNFPVDSLANHNNVAAYMYRYHDGAFVLGALAAKLSATGTIGYISAEPFPDIVAARGGYEEGALYANPDMNVMAAYTHGWEDVEKGKYNAETMINSGADYIFVELDGGNLGVYTAAQENPNTYVFVGLGGDQHSLASDVIATSLLIDWSPILEQGIIDFFSGNGLKGYVGADATYIATLKNGMCSLAPFYDFESKIPQEVQDYISGIQGDIQSGLIEVPRWDLLGKS